ncbi:MAG: hypothetical protein JNJ41_17405 [Bacteroidia bacterium]|nr:hypothetical protein [Bacteroidia bacterium]
MALTYAAFMYKIDPYFIVKPDYENKTLPYNPMYNYNLIKHYSKLDYGFLGSSAVNYYPIDSFYTTKNSSFSMGIESSNIYEHIAYGKVLASKQPKEIVFFITFYALNPSRGAQNYFHPFAVTQNNLVVDFIDQYFNSGAYLDAVKYIKKENHSSWAKEFNPNGTRTQHVYLNDTSYNAEKVLADYLAYMYIDPRYYGSKTFENPAALKKGIEAIKDFRDYLTTKGIKMKLATAPEHRMNLALIYYSNLGKTYEEFRRQLATVQPFYDLNLDTALTSHNENFWDTHHVRKGIQVMNDLKTDTYLVNSKNVDRDLAVLKPSDKEMWKLKKMFSEYKDWKDQVKQLNADLSITPSIAP